MNFFYEFFGLNQWHHIVATYDNTSETMKLFIDGIEKSSISYPGLFGSIGTNNYNLLLGAIYNGNYWFEGQQDELAIWNRAITSTEINSLYNNGLPVTLSGTLIIDLQAYFQMENNWNDSSGNNYNAEDSTASFTTDAINGSYAGYFNGIDDGVQYSTNLSTTNGLSISVWVKRTSFNEEIQTILNKGKSSDNNHIWLYFRGESVIFELGNGTFQEGLEAYITNPEDLDYHLKSEHGRWNGSSWVNDIETSPCIDNGLASSDYSNEPSPNGNLVNIGVYGNTIEASKSSTLAINESFINNFIIYPNPADSKVFINEAYIHKKYTISSLNGKIIKNGEMKNNYFDIKNLKKGVYFIKIFDNKTKCIGVSKLIIN